MSSQNTFKKDLVSIILYVIAALLVTAGAIFRFAEWTGGDAILLAGLIVGAVWVYKEKLVSLFSKKA